MTDVSATRSQGSIRVFTEKLPDFQDVNQNKHGKLSADNTRSSVRSQSRSSARLSAATSGVSSMGHTRNIENWINEKSLRRIHEKHSLEDLDSRKLCATVLRNEETFVRGIDEYLKETKLLQLRRKEILHKQWNENVYEPLRRRVQLKIEEGYPIVDERKRTEYCRYLDYTNRKGNVFLDIMSKDEYNPLSLLHPGSAASLKVRTGRLRDPLLSQERKRIDEERTILRCETGKIFTDNAIRQSWLPELPLRPSGRHGTTCASWLAMSRREVRRERLLKMAASLQENEPDSTVYESRSSFLHLLEEKQRALNKKALLHRFVYIAKLSPELADKQQVESHYEKLFKELKTQHQAEDVSGILLMYPSYVVHLIETSIEVIYGIIRDLSRMESSGTDLLIDPKILIISHDIPTRLYQQWTYRVLNITAGREEYEQGKETIESLVMECISTLLKLGLHILKTPKLNVKENLHDTVPELLIPQDLIGFLMKRNELETPKEFVDTYLRPVDVVLDDELVWPLPESLAFSQILADRAVESH